MKKVNVATNAALLLLFCSVISQAQQKLAPTKNSDSNAHSEAAGNVTGTGKKDYVPLWMSPNNLGSSKIFQSSAGEIGIGTTAPAATLDVNGAINATTGFNLGGSPFAFGTLSNSNAFLGFSGNSTMTGGANTASGLNALGNNTTGYENTASGYRALGNNTTGGLNTARGVGALELNVSGGGNTATGAQTLQSNTTGFLNTATGDAALSNNTTGYQNTAEGLSALGRNTTGSDNTASGYGALGYSNGSENTAVGMLALYSNTTGNGNTSGGFEALFYNATGNWNTALGVGAGPDVNSTNLSYATVIGVNAVVSQSNTLVLGGPLGSVAQVKVGIGTATPSNVFTIAQGAGPAIADGWNTYSSRRWKTNIHTLHDALGKVEQLRGVSYELRANGKHEVGVIAEEVGAVVPEVVTWDRNGTDAQSVDYSRLTALLIEPTKEQQKLIEQQQEQIAQLISQVKTIQASLRTSGRSDSEVRTVKADLTTVLKKRETGS